MGTNKLVNYVMAGVECATNQAKLGMTKEIPILPRMVYDRGIIIPDSLVKKVTNFLDACGMVYFVKWNSADLGIGTLVITKYVQPSTPKALREPTFYFMEMD